MKLRIKSPKWTFFWCLPLLAALAHDFFVFFLNQDRFFLSEVGYLLQHYTPWHDAVGHFSDHPFYRRFIVLLFNAKSVIAGFVFALPALLWINRPRRSDYGPAARRKRR